MTAVTISDDLRKLHPELVELIVHSESMNDEERQYWVNILPIMTPEQIDNLRDILETEKKQLAAIDKKYQTNEATDPEQTEEDIRQRRQERKAKENASEEDEEKRTAELLSKIEEL